MSIVDASVAPSPYAMVDYSDQFGSVDLATGDMGLNLPVIKIPSVEGGLGYDINLGYYADIKVDQRASWVGLGWGLGIPTINRVVRGVPDDYRPTGSPNLNVYDKSTSYEYYSDYTNKRKDWNAYFSRIGFNIVKTGIIILIYIK